MYTLILYMHVSGLHSFIAGPVDCSSPCQCRWSSWHCESVTRKRCRSQCTWLGRGIHVHTWIHKHSKPLNAAQHNTTQDLRQHFSKGKASLRWDSNPRLTHSRRNALPTELLTTIQTKAKQSEHLNLNCIITCTHVHTIMVVAEFVHTVCTSHCSFRSYRSDFPFYFCCFSTFLPVLL